MKGSHPRITLLGNNSGRNLGDAAILASIMQILTREIPTAEFLVPTINTKFIEENYGSQYNVQAINVMPWTGSIRLLGIPTMRSIAKSDLTLICDGIIFGKGLWNPAFNFLITLIFLVPWAHLVGSKVICYSCGIGPFPGFWSKFFARWVINGSDLVIMRDEDSKQLAEQIGVTQPITVTGDAAFLNLVSSEERANEIAAREDIDLSLPTLGINVTKYVDAWLKPEEQIGDKSQFLSMLAEGIRSAKDKVSDPFQCVLFSTQPMDEAFTYELASQIEAKVIHNSSYLSHDIQCMMRHCQLLVGMRFHSLVLASAVEVPVVGLVYAPKVRGYMRLLDCEAYSLELSQLSADSFSDSLVKAWSARDSMREQQSQVVSSLKKGADNAAVTVRERYFSDLEPSPSFA